MSSTIKCIAFLFISVLFSFSAEAQVLDKISGKLNAALDKTIDKFSDGVAEAMLEKFFEKIFEGKQANSDSLAQYEPDTTSNNSSLDLSGLFGSNKKVDKVFTFDHKMIMDVSNGENVNSLIYYIPTTGNHMGMEMSNVFVITDFETGDSYTILNGSLTSFNVSKMMEKYSTQLVDENETYTYKKSGRTETIAGFLSEEYTAKSEDHDMEIWVSKTFVNQNVQYSQIIQNIRNQNENSIQDGHAMRIISKDIKENTTTTIEVKSITPLKKVVDLSQY